MIRADQIPDEVVEAARRTYETDPGTELAAFTDAIAAALNAWPGMEEHVNWPDQKLTHIILPLPGASGV